MTTTLILLSIQIICAKLDRRLFLLGMVLYILVTAMLGLEISSLN